MRENGKYFFGIPLHIGTVGKLVTAFFGGIARMKQGVRFIVKPKAFFNQLQWSRNHWMILILFLGLAVVETQVGKHGTLYNSYAGYLEHLWGLNFNVALWIILALKLALIAIGAFAMSTVIYIVGSVVGKKNSRRVLFRRLTVVFTVFLAGFTLSHLTGMYPALTYASFALYLWGALLGYIAIREQFEVNHLEASIVALFAILLVSSSWQFTNRFFEANVRSQMDSLAKKTDRIDSTQSRAGTDL